MGAATLITGLENAVSQKQLDRINLFLTYCHRFRKGKNYFDKFLMCIVKNQGFIQAILIFSTQFKNLPG